MHCAVSWSWCVSEWIRWKVVFFESSYSKLCDAGEKALNFVGGAVFIPWNSASKDLQVSSADQVHCLVKAGGQAVGYSLVRCSYVSTAEKDNSSGSEWLSDLFDTSAGIVWQGKKWRCCWMFLEDLFFFLSEKKTTKQKSVLISFRLFLIFSLIPAFQNIVPWHASAIMAFLCSKHVRSWENVFFCCLLVLNAVPARLESKWTVRKIFTQKGWN